MPAFILTVISATLRKLSQLTILRYRPTIVGVTGTVGKTSTKQAIAAVLGYERSVRAAKGNFNGEIGIPLTILGDWKESELKLLSRELPPGAHMFRKALFLLKVVLVSSFRIVFAGSYPEVLVLEYGIDRPGDMKYLLRIARPNVAVMTAMGETPAHVEYFENPQAVAREKARLIESLPPTGYAILNADDGVIMGLRSRTRGQVLTYGFDKGASFQVSAFENRAEDDEPKGIAFKIGREGSLVPVRLDGLFGIPNAYSSAAAMAVGAVFGMNLVESSEALGAWYRSSPHRMELVPGERGSWIIDDSYNASPLSLRAALDTVLELPAKRRIAILGDMLEIGKYTMEEHEKAGRFLAKHIDVLLTVGPRAKFIAEGARKGGMKKNIQEFNSWDEALPAAHELLKKGDLVLVKASRAMHLDKVVEELKEVRMGE